jgi:plasmid maintenance system killer protein
VRIRDFAHKGLKELYVDDNARGVPGDSADKLRKTLAFLENMENAEELRSLPPGRRTRSLAIARAPEVLASPATVG